MIFMLTPSFRTGTKTVSTNESGFCSEVIKLYVWVAFEFDFKNDGIQFTLEIEEKFFNDVKGSIKKHLNRIDNFRDFNLERSGSYLFISYPYFVDIFNVKYDENQITENYSVSDVDNINKNALKKILDDTFKINNSNLINFRINNDDGLYNVYFY